MSPLRSRLLSMLVARSRKLSGSGVPGLARSVSTGTSGEAHAELHTVGPRSRPPSAQPPRRGAQSFGSGVDGGRAHQLHSDETVCPPVSCSGFN